MLSQQPMISPSIHLPMQSLTLISVRPWNSMTLSQTPKTKPTWTTSAANEFSRLAQRVGGQVSGTDTIQFIPYINIPPD